MRTEGCRSGPHRPRDLHVEIAPAEETNRARDEVVAGPVVVKRSRGQPALLRVGLRFAVAAAVAVAALFAPLAAGFLALVLVLADAFGLGVLAVAAVVAGLGLALAFGVDRLAPLLAPL